MPGLGTELYRAAVMQDSLVVVSTSASSNEKESPSVPSVVVLYNF